MTLPETRRIPLAKQVLESRAAHSELAGPAREAGGGTEVKPASVSETFEPGRKPELDPHGLHGDDTPDQAGDQSKSKAGLVGAADRPQRREAA